MKLSLKAVSSLNSTSKPKESRPALLGYRLQGEHLERLQMEGMRPRLQLHRRRIRLIPPGAVRAKMPRGSFRQLESAPHIQLKILGLIARIAQRQDGLLWCP